MTLTYIFIDNIKVMLYVTDYTIYCIFVHYYTLCDTFRGQIV